MNTEAQVGYCTMCGTPIERGTTQCLSCGQMHCPNCGSSVRPEEAQCSTCGASLQDVVETAAQPDLEPSEPEKPVELVPACSVCGKQDETVRAVVYPYVFSIIVASFRRNFAGVWCTRHRLLPWLGASLITLAFGWWGIPFGLVFTPVALIKLAWGGEQPNDLNAQLLATLARRKQGTGDVRGAIQCLEMSLRFKDSEDTRKALSNLYQRHDPAQGVIYSPVLRMTLVLGIVLLIGALVGVADYFRGTVATALLPGEVSYYLLILVWAPLAVMIFFAGTMTLQLIRWALRSTHSALLSIAFSAVTATFGGYAIPTGYALLSLGLLMLGSSEERTSSSELVTLIGAGLSRGGLWVINYAFINVDTWGTIYLGIVLSGVSLFVILALRAAAQHIQWQRALLPLRSRTHSDQPLSVELGWIPVTVLVLGFLALWVFFPQQTTVDRLEAASHIGRGIDLFDSGKTDPAIAELQQAVRLQPQSVSAHGNLGWIFINLQEFDKAANEFREAVRANPDSAFARSSLGWALLAQDYADDAIREFQEALRISPDSDFALTGAGRAYLALEDYGEAINRFDMAIRLNPNNPDAYGGLGSAYIRQGKLDKAIQSLEKAVQLDPKAAVYYLRLGDAFSRRAEFGKAMEHIQKSIELDQDYSVPHAFAATVYFWQDKPDLAKKEIELAQAEAKDRISYWEIAIFYYHQRQFAQAETYILKAIERSPNTADLYAEAAFIYAAQGKFDLATRMCDQAVKTRPQDADAYVARAEVLVAQEKLELALVELERAHNIMPDNAVVHQSFSEVYLYMGRYGDSVAMAREAVDLNAYGGGNYTSLAFAYHAQNRLEDALAAAQKAVLYSPRSDTAHYILGAVYLDRGDKPKAIAEMQTFLSLYWDRAYVREYKHKAEEVLKQLQ